MPTGLVRRNGRYSLRRRIPQDLVVHYGTLTNSAPYAIKDMKLKCKVISETNKTLARYRPVILKRVPANGSISFGPIDVGYVDPQAAGIYCEMVDADMIPGGAASADTASH